MKEPKTEELKNMMELFSCDVDGFANAGGLIGIFIRDEIDRYVEANMISNHIATAIKDSIESMLFLFDSIQRRADSLDKDYSAWLKEE